MKISVICPVLNEVDFIGYSIMSCLEQVHEFIYALDEKSSDGTRELLNHIKEKYAHEKLVIIDQPTFHPSDMTAYNKAFNDCISKMTGEAAWFLHPDMIVTNPVNLSFSWDASLAWWTNITSYSGDLQTVITKGRSDKWKNLHRKKFGLHYYGGYGSQNEDFYHSDITGRSYKHFAEDFKKYPFKVSDSGIRVNHYCELKGYARRLEKMKLCLKTQHPDFSEELIEDLATQHPRVTLEEGAEKFGTFKFEKSNKPIPEVFTKFKEEFSSFNKEIVHV